MSNSALVAKVRAVHGSFLSRDDYINLLHKASVPAVVAYLKAVPRYAETLADIDETAVQSSRVEALISRNVFDNYIKICKFSSAGKDSIMSFHIKQLEAEQLTKAVIAVCSGTQDEFFAAFPQYLAKYFCYDPVALASSKDLSSLAETLIGTPYHKPLAPLLNAQHPDINSCIITINSCYIEWAFRKINSSSNEKSKNDLKKFFLRKADVDNIMTCLRLRSFFMSDPSEISRFLIPYHYRLRPAEIDEALRSSDAVNAIRDLFVSERFADNVSKNSPEVSINAADFRFFRSRLALTSDETESLYSLMMLFKAEQTNLSRIIEGVKYGLAPEEIEKYLVF